LQDVKQLNRRENRSHLLSNKYGFAGYDNELDSMQSLLILRQGDRFAKGNLVIIYAMNSEKCTGAVPVRKKIKETKVK
jgi:hypothetical protein